MILFCDAILLMPCATHSGMCSTGWKEKLGAAWIIATSFRYQLSKRSLDSKVREEGSIAELNCVYSSLMFCISVGVNCSDKTMHKGRDKRNRVKLSYRGHAKDGMSRVTPRLGKTGEPKREL